MQVATNEGIRPQLLVTKLFAPRARAAMVSRRRLLARLHAGLGGTLTLVSAPAGWGKTSLLVDWLGQTDWQSQSESRMEDGGSRIEDGGSRMEKRFSEGSNGPQAEPHSILQARSSNLHPGPPVAWLSLDAGDDEPHRLMRYLVAALQTVDPALGMSTLVALNAPQPPPVNALLTLLLNDLAALDRRCVLVLDDYHVLTALPAHAAISFLLDHLPPPLHVVIASRSDPPLPLARWRARGQLTEVRAADLRFTTDEAATFLTEVMGVALSGADVAALEARTEGWIAGLQLAALAMRDRADLSKFVDAFAGSNRFVVDYLAEEVFDRQPAELKAFLLQTSILERLCGPLCDAVLGVEAEQHDPPPDASPMARVPADSYSRLMLDQLERANLFIVALDDQREWYRYHHLFAEVLRARLRQGVAGAAVAQLHRRASRWYERQGLLMEAVRYAFLTPDPERAAGLIEQHGVPLMLRNSDVFLVRSWLEQLPRALILQRPRLALVASIVAVLTGKPGAVEQLLDEAAPALEAPGLDPNLAGEVAVLRSVVARLSGDPAASLALARRADEQLDAANFSFRAVAALSRGVAYVRQDQSEAAAQAFREAARLAVAGGSLWVALGALEELGTHFHRQGQLRQAYATYHQAVQLASDAAAEPLPAAGVGQVGLAEVLYEWNDLAAASEAIEQGLQVLRASVERGLLVRGYVAQAQIHQARGEAAAALASVERCADWFAQTQLAPAGATDWLAMLRARLQIRQGDLQAAASWARERSPADGELRVAQQLTLTRLRLAQARAGSDGRLLQDASEGLGEVVARVEASGWNRYLIEAQLLQALVCQASGDAPAATEQLGRALALAQPEGYTRTFVDEGAPLRELLARALAQRDWGAEAHSGRSALRDYAQSLLAALGDPGAVPAPPSTPAPAGASAAQPLVEPLSARELEVLQLVASGLSNQDVAQRLVVAVSTVKKHLNSIFGKLEVQSRTQAIVRARELQLI